MEKMKISVIGSGNGGLTAAFHLSKNGHEVCIYDDERFSTQIDAIIAKNGIEAIENDGCEVMSLYGFSEIKLATTDPKTACDFSNILVMICPSFAQEILFEKLLPHLKDGHILVLLPGNYGGLALNEIKNKSQFKDLDLTFVDGISIPWATRIVGDATISILGTKEFLPVSIYPLNKATDELKNIISNVIPIPVEYLKHPILSGLENINFGGHPLMTVVNIGLLENFNGEYHYYSDCCSKSTANAACKMDKERIKVANALGFSVRTELEAMNALYNSNEASVYDFNRKSDTHGKLKNAPNTAKHRYITEDIPYLLVPCYHLAKLVSVEVPIITSIIHLANAYLDENFFESGRTLEKMGIKSIDDILK